MRPVFQEISTLLLTNCLASSLTLLGEFRENREVERTRLGFTRTSVEKLWPILWLDPLHFEIICHILVQRETISKSRTVQEFVDLLSLNRRAENVFLNRWSGVRFPPGLPPSIAYRGSYLVRAGTVAEIVAGQLLNGCDCALMAILWGSGILG